METLKRHLPAGGPDGLSELGKIAARFEERIFTSAENPADYLRKISLKMLTMETQSTMGKFTPSNPIGGSQNMQDQGEHLMETLKRHLPAGDPDGLSVLTKIAARFEEKIFTNAENQADYLREISLMMLTMETESAVGNSMASNPIGEKPKYARSCVRYIHPKSHLNQIYRKKKLKLK
ncbi:hypothetical protein AMTRI_Chr06g196680 [Amborella trichopoda]